MMAVIFEVLPHPDQRATYLDMAAALAVQLAQIEGFISIERFESLSQPGKLLSLSFWQDEAAIQRWRTAESHRGAQQAGREHVFADYRLRVASVVRDYGLHERDQVPDEGPPRSMPKSP